MIEIKLRETPFVADEADDGILLSIAIAGSGRIRLKEVELVTIFLMKVIIREFYRKLLRREFERYAPHAAD